MNASDFSRSGQRIDILQKLKNDISAAQIVIDYDIRKILFLILRIVSNIKKYKNVTLIKYQLAKQEKNLEKKMIHKSKYNNLEERLCMWFLERKESRDKITYALFIKHRNLWMSLVDH